MPSQARWLLKECLFFLLLVLNEIIIREGPEKQILSRKQNKKGLSRKNNPGAEAAELGSQ